MDYGRWAKRAKAGMAAPPQPCPPGILWKSL
jgi:hypothetical protein